MQSKDLRIVFGFPWFPTLGKCFRGFPLTCSLTAQAPQMKVLVQPCAFWGGPRGLTSEVRNETAHASLEVQRCSP